MGQQKLLEVIQVQRHDFLNHLQVVSGFLQLNKPQQAGNYIKQVIADLQVISQTAWLVIPEVTAALLVGFNEAAKIQMEMLLDVDTKMDACAVPDTEVGNALEVVLDHFFENLSPQRLANGSLPSILLRIQANTPFLFVPGHPT